MPSHNNKSAPSNMLDYTPISVLPALFKAILNGEVTFKWLSVRFSYSSIELLKITNDWLIATDERLVSLLVLLDFSNAFDSVNHHLLCSKLSDQFGFTTSAVSLIMSYLSDRSPVCADSRCFIGCSSHNFGCCAGPLLFSMFINDIVYQITSCHVHLFADDVHIYISYEPHHIENCIRNMNLDLDRNHLWSIENFLAINSEKSQALLG
jgi:hypothetical protein